MELSGLMQHPLLSLQGTWRSRWSRVTRIGRQPIMALGGTLCGWFCNLEFFWNPTTVTKVSGLLQCNCFLLLFEWFVSLWLEAWRRWTHEGHLMKFGVHMVYIHRSVFGCVFTSILLIPRGNPRNICLNTNILRYDICVYIYIYVRTCLPKCHERHEFTRSYHLRTRRVVILWRTMTMAPQARRN